MRLRQFSFTVGLVAGLGATLTACSDRAPVSAATPAAAPAAAVLPVELPVEDVPQAVPSGPAAGGGTRRCTAGDLRATVAARTPGAPGVQQIELANRGSAVCTMKGYPGVDLVSDTGTWSLPRSRPGTARTVTLAPGGTAYVLIDYVAYAGPGGSEFKVTGMVLTPPDDTAQLTVHWEGANPQDQRTAARPATAVRPVTTRP